MCNTAKMGGGGMIFVNNSRFSRFSIDGDAAVMIS